MFIKKSFFILSIVALISSTPAFAKFNFALYNASKDSYSIIYPDNWEKVEQNSTYRVVSFKSPVESNADNFIENVNVVVEKAPGYNLAQYFKANLKIMGAPNALQGFKILKSGSQSLNNKPAKYVIYTHSYSNIPLKVKAYFLCNGKNGYVITCTAKADAFNNYESTFDQIINSFKLK